MLIIVPKSLRIKQSYFHTLKSIETHHSSIENVFFFAPFTRRVFPINVTPLFNETPFYGTLSELDYYIFISSSALMITQVTKRYTNRRFKNLCLQYVTQTATLLPFCAALLICSGYSCSRFSISFRFFSALLLLMVLLLVRVYSK